MIPQNLMDYVKIYENHVDPKVCKDIVKNLQNIEWEKHQYYDSFNKKYVRYDHELSVSHGNIPESDLLNRQVWLALKKYILEDFASFGEWFGGWSGYSYVRFNKYDPTTQMKLHCDHITTLFDGERRGVPVLTILGALNDDYEGGELIMFGDKQIELPAGAVVVFPSNFQYPHEVKPVKSGVRYSYVSWSW